MAFAAVSAPEAEIADSSAAAQYIADGCLMDAPLRCVGLELEGHCHDPADPYRRPGWDEISDVLEHLPVLPGRSVVTVEPGGPDSSTAPGWAWCFSGPIRCGHRSASTRARATAPWNSSSTPAAPGRWARR